MIVRPDLNFKGQTYVAFSDLSGFKKMMKEPKQAAEALDALFKATYDYLKGEVDVSGIAVSDCVISWTRDRQLNSIVNFVSALHKEMIEKSFLLVTTIAYGQFKYQERIQLRNLQKANISGGAYLRALLANEKSRNRTGQILLVRDNLPIGIPNQLKNNGWRWQKGKKYWEYFWSAKNPKQLELITTERKNADELKFERLKSVYSSNLRSK